VIDYLKNKENFTDDIEDDIENYSKDDIEDYTDDTEDSTKQDILN
jgi:hypothetical protein